VGGRTAESQGAELQEDAGDLPEAPGIGPGLGPGLGPGFGIGAVGTVARDQGPILLKISGVLPKFRV